MNQNIGIIGKSDAKLADEKAELKAELKEEMEAYADAHITAMALLSHKLIEGTVQDFELPVGISSIKDYLLYNSSALKSIDLSGCKSLGENALAKCYFVNSIDVSNAQAYKQFGNAVNVKVIKYCARLRTILIFLSISKLIYEYLRALIILLTPVGPIPGTRSSISYEAVLTSTGN